MTRFSDYLTEYGHHAALNVGQALQGMRYVYSHPDMDAKARRGSPTHLLRSLGLRSMRIANDLFFATFPPHWHHGDAEILSLRGGTPTRWFQYGYCAWRFNETGAFKTLTGEEDRRWDRAASERAGAREKIARFEANFPIGLNGWGIGRIYRTNPIGRSVTALQSKPNWAIGLECLANSENYKLNSISLSGGRKAA